MRDTELLAPGGCARPDLPGPDPAAPERFSNWGMLLQGEEERLKEFEGSQPALSHPKHST